MRSDLKCILVCHHPAATRVGLLEEPPPPFLTAQYSTSNSVITGTLLELKSDPVPLLRTCRGSHFTQGKSHSPYQKKASSPSTCSGQPQSLEDTRHTHLRASAPGLPSHLRGVIPSSSPRLIHITLQRLPMAGLFKITKSLPAPPPRPVPLAARFLGVICHHLTCYTFA